MGFWRNNFIFFLSFFHLGYDLFLDFDMCLLCTSSNLERSGCSTQELAPTWSIKKCSLELMEKFGRSGIGTQLTHLELGEAYCHHIKIRYGNGKFAPT